MLPKKLAFVDVETTGTSATHNRIIEIGILRVEDDKIVQAYNTLLNPQCHLPPEIEQLTGIHEYELENAPTFNRVKNDILELLSDAVFVAHNVRFDYSFLRSEFAREEISFSSKHFCTVKLSRSLFPRFKHHNLDAIIQRFNFSCENRHRAFDDAKILFDFYQKAQQLITPEIFQNAVNLGLRKPSIPTQLSAGTVASLPEQPGVYIFYGDEDIPLYVGKSINVKDRVLSHFSNDLFSATEMQISQQVKRIETIVTAGEMGALLTESALIKSMLPIYNKRLRNKRELTALRKITDEHGFQTARIETLTKITPEDFPTLLGFFRSKKQAKEYLSMIAKDYLLCEKILGLEKTNGACFSYRLGACKGACVKEELPLMYNLRFLTAFGKEKIQHWPFPSPILITEQNELSKKTEYFLLDKWCYLGSIKEQNPEDLSDFLSQEYKFDLDVYKIIRGFLRKLQNQSRIKVLKHLDKQLTLSQNQFPSSY